MWLIRKLGGSHVSNSKIGRIGSKTKQENKPKEELKVSKKLRDLPSCDLRCRVCEIKNCCGNCLHSILCGDGDMLVVVCAMRVISETMRFPRYKPIFIETCDRWTHKKESHR